MAVTQEGWLEVHDQRSHVSKYWLLREAKVEAVAFMSCFGGFSGASDFDPCV